MAPNVSMTNAERIKIGAYSHIGARCSLWAGNSVGRVTLGHHALLGPEVFITAANYGLEPGTPIMDQPMDERDVVAHRRILSGVPGRLGPGQTPRRGPGQPEQSTGRAWAHLLRMVHYYNYSHVRPKQRFFE